MSADAARRGPGRVHGWACRLLYRTVEQLDGGEPRAEIASATEAIERFHAEPWRTQLQWMVGMVHTRRGRNEDLGLLDWS